MHQKYIGRLFISYHMATIKYLVWTKVYYFVLFKRVADCSSWIGELFFGIKIYAVLWFYINFIDNFTYHVKYPNFKPSHNIHILKMYINGHKRSLYLTLLNPWLMFIGANIALVFFYLGFDIIFIMILLIVFRNLSKSNAIFFQNL